MNKKLKSLIGSNVNTQEKDSIMPNNKKIDAVRSFINSKTYADMNKLQAILAVYLAIFEEKGEVSLGTQDKLAKMLGVKKKKVQDALKELKEKKLVYSYRESTVTNTYKVKNLLKLMEGTDNVQF